MKITKVVLLIVFNFIIIGCVENNEPITKGTKSNREAIFNPNTAPVFLSKGPYKVEENVKEAFQIKAKNSNKLKYYLSKKDFNLLYVDIISGEVFFKEPTNYKEKPKYEVNAIIQDPLGNKGTQEVVVNVNKSSNREFITAIDQGIPLHNYHHNEYFITTWKTDNIGVSKSNQITIPTIGDGYNYSVDWGDGTSSRRLSTDVTHTYSKVGIYTVKIVGDFPRIYFAKNYDEQDETIDNDAKKLLTIEQWGKTKWVSMGGAFTGCSNMRVNTNDTPDLSQVTDMHYMFYQASNFNQNIEDWNVSNVENMRGLLYEASSFNQSLASWDVSEVTNMNNMLAETSISTNSYDNTLNGWSNQTLQENVDFSISDIPYSNNSSEAREHLTNRYNWEITDGNLTDKEDIIQPTITLLGDTTIILNVGDTYNDLGATATDNIDKNLTENIIETSNVNTSRSGTYTVTYIVRDNAGNKTRINRTVIVNKVSNEKPIIKLLGKNLVNLSVGESYIDEGAKAYDKEDGDISNSIVVSSTVNSSIIGTYTITYDVIDSDNNLATTVTRTVNVVKLADIIKPTITLKGENPVTITQNESYVDAGATAEDNIDGDITNKIVINNPVDMTKIGTYIVTYNVIDNAGNKANKVIRTVIVKKPIDKEAPLIKLNGQDNIFITKNSIYIEQGAIVTDNIDTNLKVTITGSVNTTTLGVYTLTYSAIDSAKNRSSITRTVNVIDASKPIITLLGQSPIDIDIGSIYIDAGATAQDKEDGDITKNIKTTNLVDTSKAGKYTVRYNISDEAGNKAVEVTRTVNVIEAVVLPDYTTSLTLSQTDFKEEDTPVTITIKVTELLGGNNTGALEVTLPLNQDLNMTMENNSDWQFNNEKTFARFIYIGNNGEYTPKTASTIVLKGTFHAQENTKGSFTISTSIRDGSGDINSDNDNDTVKITYENILPQTLTRKDAHTHSNCKGYIEKSGEDTNENGVLDDNEITSTNPVYEEGTPITLTELKDKIANDEDVTGVNTCEITNMGFLFLDNTTFNQDIGGWNVGSVTTMRNMFYKASNFNQDIGEWDVSNVTEMIYMFVNASKFNQNIGAWNVSKVTNMNALFKDASAFNQNIESWNVSKVTNMDSMFFQAKSFNQNLGLWDVSNVTNMNSMFISATNFNQDISSWDVSNVTNMSSMFNSTAFNQDINSWDVSNVTNMKSMFTGAKSFNQNISSWNVSKVTDMSWMFYWAENFNQNINSWDISKVTNMYGMFWNTKKFNQNLSLWNVSNVTNMGYMFSGSIFNQDISSWGEKVSKVTDMRSMFSYTSSFNQDISSWDTSRVTYIDRIFYNAKAFNQDLEQWDVSSVTNMTDAFTGSAVDPLPSWYNQ